MIESGFSFSRLENAFKEVSQKCTCIDEGMTEGQVRSAGSGILYPGGATEVAALLHKMGIAEVTSHEGCGAAKKAAVEQGADPSEAEERGIAFAKEVVVLMNALRGPHEREVVHRHISLAEMQRPAERHDAIAVYYDLTGRCNPAKVSELPKGFVVTRKNNDRALADAQLAVQIALGKSGQGKEYFMKYPLRFIITAEPGADEEVMNAREELASVVKSCQDEGVLAQVDVLYAPAR
jgi:hypothetical protein